MSVDTSAGCTFSCNVTLVVSDGFLSSSCSTTVSFEDTTAPVLALNGAGYLLLEARRDTYVEMGATASDACDTQVAVAIGGGPVNTSVPGMYLVTYDARDRCGNAAASVTRTVEVKDTLPPAFTRLPNDLTVECEGPAGVPATHSDIVAFLNTPEVSDSCDPEVGISHDAPAVFPMGSSRVTWTAQDFSGNVVTASRLVEVADATPPVMVCPADVTLECPADMSVEANGVAAAFDRCGGATVASSDVFAPACGETGTITRTWTATDGAGNASTCLQTLNLVDTAPPVLALSGAGHLVLECKVDTYVELGAAASDRCDPEVEVTIGGDRVNSRVLGTYVVTYDAQDRCGNHAAQVTRTVEVKDTVPPSFSRLPNDLSVECEGPGGVLSTNPEVATFLATAEASDTCDGSVPVTVNAPAVFPVGDTLVTWTARDLSGNPVTASRMVHVTDTMPPVLVCPADVLAECPYDTSVERNGSASATDLCGDASVSYTEAQVPGCGGGLTLTRTWRAVDGSGNAAVCAQTIRVVDTMAPLVFVSADPESHGRGTLVHFSATDGCGTPTVTAVVDTGCRRFPVADGEVVKLTGSDFGCRSDSASVQDRVAQLVVTAVDGCGNSRSASVEVLFHPDSATVEPTGMAFLRGDANGDQSLDPYDVQHIVNLHFGRAQATACMEAADANDDGAIGLDDAAYVATVLCRGGSLPVPFPIVGCDPTPDGLGCSQYPAPEGPGKHHKNNGWKNGWTKRLNKLVQADDHHHDSHHDR
jgi:hypothetical protein